MEHNDDHYYTEGYSIEDDPYVSDNGVLINLLDLKDTDLLNQAESDYTSVEIKQLLLGESPKEFDAAYLQYLHRMIFGRVYPWAGKFRTVGIGKQESKFLMPDKIQSSLDALFKNSKQANYFTDMSHEEFSDHIGKFLIELNHIHPFREGNGRTQRLLVSKLAQNAGFQMDWQSISNEAMKRACIEGVEGNTRAMVRMILLNTQQK